MVYYFVGKDERVESKGTHEGRLIKMRNGSLLLPLLCLLDENIWCCKERDGVPLYKLVLFPHKKMKEPRFLLTLQTLSDGVPTNQGIEEGPKSLTRCNASSKV